MKVYISKYRNHWYSPYTWIDYLFFWTKWSKCSRHKGVWDESKPYYEAPDWVEKLATFLTPISVSIQWVLDKVHPRVEYVKLDSWDTWNMDHTLALIALPMLKQLQATKHGSPHVDDADVPEELRSTSAPAKVNEWDTDSNHFKRWDYVLGEMIFAFEHLVDSKWEDAYSSGEIDFITVPVDVHGNEVPKGEHKYYQWKDGPNHTYKCDYNAIQEVYKRIDNGLLLFGKYYRGLWD